mgnify:CR=1 FL=1
MKWILLLSIIASFLLIVMFSMNLANTYNNIFIYGMLIDQSVIQTALRYITEMILIFFTVISIIQIFMQFRPEKNQETGRFLKSLPIKREEFFKIKLAIGVANITIAFIILILGIIIARNNNMFWIEDIYNISIMPKPYIEADSVMNLLKEIGLLYLIVLSFYGFLFMVQYTFSNVVGGIVTGILVWLSPIFIVLTSIHSLERLNIFSTVSNVYTEFFNSVEQWLSPWLYPFNYDYNYFYGAYSMIKPWSINVISYLRVKYLILTGLILISLLIAHKFNQSSKVENENMVIPFRSIRIIFIIGVTICSGLLLAFSLSEIINIRISNTIYILLLIVGGAIGYFISSKIAKIGIK